jgi:hypothetical protein
MNNKLFAALGLVCALAAGAAGGYAANKLTSSPFLASDFAGGITPMLHAATTTGGLSGNGYIYPAGSLAEDAANGLSVGGSDQYHGLTVYATASGTPASVVTLGAFGVSTSSATTTITIPETAGLAVGAICSGSAATTTVFISGCVLASTNGATGTATVAYSNLTGSALSVPTSTPLRISFDQLPY